MDQAARVVLALEAPDVVEEVLHFLDRSGRARVVATAADDRQLAEAVRQLEPDVVVAQPSLVTPAAPRSHPFLAVDTRESVASLRGAIRCGADGFFLWPADRSALIEAVGRAMAPPVAADRAGAVIAVHGARGGTGTTFVATHLAAALERGGSSCVLLDADPLYGDVAAALGAPSQDVHTAADLAPLGSELSPSHLQDALWTHPSGFRTLLAPDPDEAVTVGADDLRAAIEAAASIAGAVVLHVPRTLDDRARVCFALADRVVEVLSLDVLSFRAATRALEVIRPIAGAAEVGFVVNRAARSEVVPGDVARVFGASPLVVLPYDRSVTRAQDHGRLLPARGRVGRSFDRLSAAVIASPSVADEAEAPETVS